MSTAGKDVAAAAAAATPFVIPFTIFDETVGVGSVSGGATPFDDACVSVSLPLSAMVVGEDSLLEVEWIELVNRGRRITTLAGR